MLLEQNWIIVFLLVSGAVSLCLLILLLAICVRQGSCIRQISNRLDNTEKSVRELEEALQVLAEQQNALHKNDFAQDVITENPENYEPATQDDQFCDRVQSLIAANYTDPLYTPARLIEDMCMSRSLFHRKSTALLGQSAGRLINSYRMEKARELICSHNDMNISDVAYAVGFNDPKYFTRFFTKFYGCSPSKIVSDQQ